VITQHDFRSPHVLGVLPRSIYDHDFEVKAMVRGIEMVTGCLHPVFITAARRVIGIAQGRGPFSDNVRFMRLPRRRQQGQNLAALKSFYEMPWPSDDEMRLMPFIDSNNLINALSAGQFGRTYFAKTPTTTGVANTWYDLWPVAGNPASGLINGTAKTANIFTDASTGAISHRGNVSTATKHMLSKWAVTTANTPMLMLYDRVVSYDQNPYSASVNETMTNTNVAARYNAGAPGLLIICCVCTVNGATAVTFTQLRYTNDQGIALQTMPTTPTVNIVVSGAAPTATLGARVIAPSTGATPCWGPFLPLAKNDYGTRLINDYTPSAANTGTVTFALVHPITEVMLPVAASPTEMDCVYQIPELEQIFDGACIAMMAYQVATTLYTLQGSIRFGWST